MLGIIALIFGLLTFVPILGLFTGVLAIICGIVGLILGFVGRSKAKQTGAGRGSATTGLILSAVGLVLVIVAGVVYGVAFSRSAGDLQDLAQELEQAAGQVESGAGLDSMAGDTSVFDVGVGQCINNPGSGDQIQTVPTVSCSEPHDGEVFALVNHPDGAGAPYPGQSTLHSTADNDLCLAQFESYVGTAYVSSRYFITSIVPSEQSWGEGDREIICILYVPGEQTTGSAAGSGQ